MTMPNPTPAEPLATAPGTATSAPQQVNSEAALQSQVAEWQSRFAGLQRTYQAERTKALTDSATLMETKTKLENVLGDYEAAKVQMGDVAKVLDSVKGEKDSLQSKYDRLELIAKTSPNLLTLEFQGLLPEGKGDELKAKLALLNTNFETAGKEKAKTMLEAVLPTGTPSAPPAADSPEELQFQALRLYREGKEMEADALMVRYYNATGKN